MAKKEDYIKQNREFLAQIKEQIVFNAIQKIAPNAMLDMVYLISNV